MADGMYYIAATGVVLAKRVWTLPITTGVAALVNVGLNLVLIPRYGIIGAAVATVVAQAVSICGLFIWSQRFWHIPYAWRQVIVGIVCGAVALGLGLGVRLPGPGADLAWRTFTFFLFWGLLIVTRVLSLSFVSQVLSRARSQ